MSVCKNLPQTHTFLSWCEGHNIRDDHSCIGCLRPRTGCCRLGLGSTCTFPACTAHSYIIIQSNTAPYHDFTSMLMLPLRFHKPLHSYWIRHLTFYCSPATVLKLIFSLPLLTSVSLANFRVIRGPISDITLNHPLSHTSVLKSLYCQLSCI